MFRIYFEDYLWGETSDMDTLVQHIRDIADDEGDGDVNCVMADVAIYGLSLLQMQNLLNILK